MITPNIHFEGTPIEFKEINPNDFDSKYYHVRPKEVIAPNKKGYISDDLGIKLKADLDNQNTTIINAGVGQGKTRAIIEVLTMHAYNPDYIIIIAVPYKSLIEQYVKDCSKYISKDEIFNLSKYETNIKKGVSKTTKESWGFTNDVDMLPITTRVRSKIHVMTINALIGNPGDDNLFTSKVRSNYFKLLKSYCENNDKKMIWLMDEIHDSIHNFKEQFVFNLWNFHGLVHKAYIISATFNEASKEVIKYVSEFTDKNIFIIESKRLPKPLRQSNLHLNFYVDQKLYQDSNLVSLVSSLVREKKLFDILVYSKTLVEKLINPNKASNSKVKTVSDVLKDQIHQVNRCYSDAFNSKANKKYIDKKDVINIGTNFSTGVNIEQEKHTFIILFPKDLSVDYVHNKGVFTNGSNVIVQALARQRKNGDIHVFLPNPDGIKLDSLPYTKAQNKHMYDCFETHKRGSDKYSNYSSINSQSKLLENAYKKLVDDVSYAEEKLRKTNRAGLNRLLYPTKEIFILNQGEKYITKEFFGGNLSAYILWASIGNQFLNCKLKSIKASTKLNFDKENLFDDVKSFINFELEELNNTFEEFNLYDSFSAYEKLEFLEKLTGQMLVNLDSKKATQAEINKILLMILSAVFFDSNDFVFREAKVEMYKLYLKSCLFYGNNLHEVNENLKTRDLTSVKIFKKWYQLIELIEKSKIEKDDGVFRLPITPSDKFESEFYKIDFKESLNYLLNNDFLLGTDVFQFKNTIITAIKNKTLVDTFYKICIKVCYLPKTKQTSKDGKKVNYYEVASLDFKNLPNLLYKPLPEVIL